MIKNRNLDGSDLTFAADREISFIEDGHRYQHSSGAELTSVSEVYMHYFKKFDADYWAQRKARRMGLNPEALAERWACNGARASFAGTHLHRQIERYFNGDQHLDEKCIFNFIGQYVGEVEEQIDISTELSYFGQFLKDHGAGLHPFRTEWVVYDLDLKMAGTIDLVCRTGDREVELYDWKRSNKLIGDDGLPITTSRYIDAYGINGLEDVPDVSYWHYALQQNLYRYILEHNYGLEVKAMHLVVLHPANGSYHLITLPKCDSEVKLIVDNLQQGG